MAGEDPELETESQPEPVVKGEKSKKIAAKAVKTEELGNLYDRPAWKRLVVICAGAAVNIVFGILIFVGITAHTGIPLELTEARISATMPNSPAAQANLPSNVSIIVVGVGDEKTSVSSAKEVQDFIAQHRGQTISLETTGQCQGLSCEEKSQSFSVYVRLPAETPADQGALGIIFENVIYHHYPWYEMPFRATAFAVEQAMVLTGMILGALGSMISSIFTQGKVPSELSGPVGIVHEFQKNNMASQGPLVLLSFMAVLSLNLGVMNLLPIPALDGGRALFVILEKILGRAKTSQIEHYAHLGGYVFLLSLIVLITMRDVWKLFL